MCRISVLIVSLGSVLALYAAPIRQQSIPDLSKKTAFEVAEYLGHEAFDIREAASEELKRRGEKAYGALDSASHSADPEVRWRATRIIDELDKKHIASWEKDVRSAAKAKLTQSHIWHDGTPWGYVSMALGDLPYESMAGELIAKDAMTDGGEKLDHLHWETWKGQKPKPFCQPGFWVKAPKKAAEKIILKGTVEVRYVKGTRFKLEKLGERSRGFRDGSLITEGILWKHDGRQEMHFFMQTRLAAASPVLTLFSADGKKIETTSSIKKQDEGYECSITCPAGSAKPSGLEVYYVREERTFAVPVEIEVTLKKK